MAISAVKRKFPVARLAVMAGITALLSWSGLIPAAWIEYGYARRVFPTISHIASFFADAVPFSWLDVWILVTLYVLAFSLRRRNWRLPLGLVCAGYLIFFWGWGLNYHRLPLESRLGLISTPPNTEEELDRFSEETAVSLNRLWPIVAAQGSGVKEPKAVQLEAVTRVRQVIARIDGTDWSAASRIKRSYMSDWWFHAAGVDGLFDPFAHEPILAGGIPDFELPFLMAHELAHVHGIADEGDANFIAFLATVGSVDPGFQYSAAFEMWLHLGRTAKTLELGPRRDLQAYLARLRSQEVPAVSRLQSAILDTHLKANGVHSGLKSYSRFVALALATRNQWKFGGITGTGVLIQPIPAGNWLN